MDNHEKLKTCKTITFVLNRPDGPPIGTPVPRPTQEQLEMACKRAGESVEKYEAEEQRFLETRHFPPDLAQAARVAMAELFGEFVTAEEVGEYEMSKVWELLQTAVDRRQWLTKISKPTTVENDADWPGQREVARRLGANPGDIARLLNSGDLKDNGKTGSQRKVDPASVLRYCHANGIVYNVDSDHS